MEECEYDGEEEEGVSWERGGSLSPPDISERKMPGGKFLIELRVESSTRNLPIVI
jgi:hypothetical protein